MSEILTFMVNFIPGKSVRLAPVELPQIRKEARVDGCSGAISDLPFFNQFFSQNI